MTAQSANHWRAIGMFFAASFLLHLFWENLQAPLYQGYSSFNQHFWICLKAAATGDMLIMLTIYAALAFHYRDFVWVANYASYSHPITWILAVMIGIFLATSYEFWAVYVAHRWVYAGMPLVPIIGVGLTPILQMIVVPLLTLSISRFSSRL